MKNVTPKKFFSAFKAKNLTFNITRSP